MKKGPCGDRTLADSLLLEFANIQMTIYLLELSITEIFIVLANSLISQFNAGTLTFLSIACLSFHIMAVERTMEVSGDSRLVSSTSSVSLTLQQLFPHLFPFLWCSFGATVPRQGMGGQAGVRAGVFKQP